MISAEHLRKGPWPEEENLKIDEKLPTLSDEQIRAILVEKHEAARATARQIRGLGESDSDSRKSFIVFDMRASSELSYVYRKEGDNIQEEAVSVCERERLQKIAFDVMHQYGLDESRSKPRHATGAFNSEGVMRCNDVVSREILVYPSQTIPGVSFRRWRDFYSATDGTIYVDWAIEGQKQPFRRHFER